ncbi:MAG: methionine adenosyltransferase [Patescibacteria group bacterium]
MFTQFASESVAAGHPDKICDQISDAIVDACLSADPKSRVAVETLVTTNQVVLAGEVTCSKNINYEKIARETIAELGYTKPDYNFSNQSPIETYIHQQSADIAQGVDLGGAGDQGMMFGYAVNETPELMPMPIMMAHALVEELDKLRNEKSLPYLRPDGKAQVVVSYENSKPIAVSTVIMAAPHDPSVTQLQLTEDLFELAVRPVVNRFLPQQKITQNNINLIINGTGAWEIGGPASDTGVTGRKIIVDTYGGMGRHGGGCFSGKDPSKVDRSAAYACRYLAKNIVGNRLAERCEVNVAYVIGKPNPVSLQIDTFGTAEKPERVIYDFARDLLDMSVPKIIEKLDLRKPVYKKTAAYGHFGRDGFSWEKVEA